jgi:Ca2+-binding RTX toxin-like protein
MKRFAVVGAVLALAAAALPGTASAQDSCNVPEPVSIQVPAGDEGGNRATRPCDEIFVINAAPDSGTLIPGAGFDRVQFATAAVTVDLSMSTVTGAVTFSLDGPSTEEVRGSDTAGAAGGDTLLGDGDNNILRGRAGPDEIHGRAEADSLFGGDGNDTLLGNAGPDFLDGGNGNDVMDGGNGADSCVGGGAPTPSRAASQPAKR